MDSLHAQANDALARGETERALGIYREALNLQSNDALLHYDFSVALSRSGNQRDREIHLQQAASLDPNLVAAHYQLGLLYMKEGKNKESEAEFKNALSVEPQHLEAQVSLGVLYAKQSRTDEAKVLFRQAIQASPDAGPAHANLGLLLANEGKNEESERHFKEAARILPHDENVLRSLASVQSKLGRLSESSCTLGKLAEVQPASARAQLDFGQSLLALYRFPAALDRFSEAIRLSPKSEAARLNKGRTLYDLGRLEEARQELQAASQLSPTETTSWYLLALVERQSKALPQSIKRLEEVVKLNSQDSDALFLLGKNWFEIGDVEKAANHWKEALRAHPDHWESLYHLASVLPSHEKESAIHRESLRALQNRHRLDQKVDLLLRLAQEAAAARNWSGSLVYLEDALQECDPCGSAREVHRGLAMVYSQIGNLGAALKELQVVLRLRPNDKTATELMRRIEEAKTNGCDSHL